VPSTELAPAPRPDHSHPTEHTDHTGRPVADVPLAELVDAARSGCPGAWRAVVDRFDAGLHAVAHGYGLDSASVDDAVQQTWLAAVTHLAALRESAALWGWLRRILHRECLRAVSRANREMPVVEQELGEPVATVHVALRAAPAPTPEDQVIRNAQVAALRVALRRLSRREQQLMTLLSDSHEHSYTDIAAALDLPVGSIGPTRARCIAKLRPLLAG
jgi:RNA polymerase sigma factor (sigma-70 family)